MARQSRRNFLGGAAAGMAAGVFGSMSKSSAQQVAAIQEMRADVVVVGGGIGGLTAAARALQQGARVIVLEKAYEVGGTTKHSEGGVQGTTYESARRGAPDGDPETQRMIADNVGLGSDFLRSIGSPISGGPGQRGGSIAPTAWVHYMASHVQSKGGQILVETPLVRLLTNRWHEVVGALAEGPKGPIRILAKAVVLATGGWMGNAQMVTAHITRHFGMLHQRNAGWGNKPPFVGDGFFAATAIGAAPSVGPFDGFYGHMLPARPAMPRDPMANYSLYHGNWGISVNLYGQRYTDETRGKRAGGGVTAGEMGLNQEAARQLEATVAYIWDEPVNQTRACPDCALGGLWKVDAYKLAGAPIAVANTLADLARQMEAWNRGIPAESVLRELTEYNMAAENGKAWALRIPKTVPEQAVPLKVPPFYAVLGTAGITSTFGGLRVNAQSQVMSRTGRPIRGLYAAGVDIGGWSTYSYNGNLVVGCASGYVSGTHAAKQPQPTGGWDVTITG